MCIGYQECDILPLQDNSQFSSICTSSSDKQSYIKYSCESIIESEVQFGCFSLFVEPDSASLFPANKEDDYVFLLFHFFYSH